MLHSVVFCHDTSYVARYYIVTPTLDADLAFLPPLLHQQAERSKTKPLLLPVHVYHAYYAASPEKAVTTLLLLLLQAERSKTKPLLPPVHVYQAYYAA
jgi:hypothetical protein